MKNLWRDADAGSTDIEQLVYLSNLIGRDTSLVQPGGGNTSAKLRVRDAFGRPTEALVVKGSGTDLRTIDAAGFTRLDLAQLALLRRRRTISDETMMRLMRATMLHPDRDPVPSVETPLHALLPQRFVAHTHDVATLSLTDTPHAERNVRRVFGDEVVFLEYIRPGFPLARSLAERLASGAPEGAIALVLEKHGLAVWGDSAKRCYQNLRKVINAAEAFVAERSERRPTFGGATVAPPRADRRRAFAAELLPVIRGALTNDAWRPVLHLDTSPATLRLIGSRDFARLAPRGVMTPEHILRAGRRPLVLKLDLDRPISRLKRRVRTSMRDFHDTHAAYVAARGESLLPDYLKVVAIPGLGIVYAGKDRRGALVAAECYGATLRAIAGAEAVERFVFLADCDAHEMEYWPLERRKVEERARQRRELEGKVAVVIGAASGIGRATAERFAAEGAFLLLADIDAAGVARAAAEINARSPEHAASVAADVSDSRQVAGIFRTAVFEFGGVDALFYSPGLRPEFHPVVEMPDAEVERKLAVHYQGAVAATREAARVMIDQGRGGRLVYNASKAAVAPGEGFAAYGASKAALVQYVRNVANELGRHGITANYVNADAVDTPMFRGVLRQRARLAGKSQDEMLAAYEQRSVLRHATVPPEAVADAAVFLASDRSAYTTGCVITVGGGQEAFPR